MSDSLERLQQQWRSKRELRWDPETLSEFCRDALKFGAPALAFDIARAGLERFPGRPELAYLAALSLAKGGSSSSARFYLRQIQDLANDDPLRFQTLSLEGRIEKDCWLRLPRGPHRDAVALRSAQYYGDAFERSRDIFPGINAATMNFVAGTKKKGIDLAKEIRALCEAPGEGEPDYWRLATRGEACLLLGSTDEALRSYKTAARRAGNRYGDIAAMRRQVRIIAEARKIDDSILEALRIPRIVLFSGHMIDTPDRAAPRFPATIEPEVKNEIARAVDDLDAGFGYCSAACGGDLLFVEAMLERKAEVHLTLPFKREDFVHASVAFAGRGWVDRFEGALARATSVRYATDEGYLNDDILFSYGQQIIQGQAILRARQLEVDPVLLVLLDGESPRHIGGTFDTLLGWKQRGYQDRVLDLSSIRQESQVENLSKNLARPPTAVSIPSRTGPSVPRNIRTMLFADVVGFSRLGDADAPSFFVGFLTKIAEVIRRSEEKPLFRNTWGDGLFLVFADVIAAAEFALRLRDAVAETEWKSLGLPQNTSIRIGMHSGPVFPSFDPIIERDNFYGSHVNRAARIEPVTTPGAVFISEQTACLLESANPSGFAWDYLGPMALAKQYGESALYRLRRESQAE